MDRYDLCHCEPAIDATILMEVTNHLNKKDDMGYLVRKMRKLDAGYVLLADQSVFLTFLFFIVLVGRSFLETL